MLRSRRLLAALVACACAAVARASATCSTPEPEWLVSPWWPEDAVFRCGCGWTQNGTVAAWNNVAICAAFGDLLFATGSPVAMPRTVNPPVLRYWLNWTMWPQTGWGDAVYNVSTDYCTFSRVVCGKSAVGIQPTNLKESAGLYMDKTGLVGTLPASFGALAALPDISAVTLSNPGLTVDATILLPFAPALQSLSLSGATLVGNALPIELAAMTSLTALYLSGSALGGTLPVEYSALSRLTSLSLNDNALTGSIPDAWAAMSSMTSLDLSSNHLQGSIPGTVLCNMPALENANLNANAFDGSIPSLSCLQMLQLDLRNNYLSGSIPSDLAAGMICTNATAAQLIQKNFFSSLGLAGNQLTGSLPFSLTNATCINQLGLQRPVIVCPAGSSEAGAATSSDVYSSSAWQVATCAQCSPGFFSSTPGALMCTPCTPGFYSSMGATSCSTCNAGSYLSPVSATPSAPCVQCPPGSFSSAAGALQCAPCEPGYFSEAGATGCTACDAGTFLNATSGVCDPCQPGTSSQRAAVTCTACQANTFAAADATACLSCPDSSTSYVGSPDLSSCTCALGAVPKYAADNRTFACVQCSAGSYHDTAAGACRPCPSNTYSSGAGAVLCTPVDAGFVATTDGMAQAPCPEGTFFNLTQCSQCMPGTFAASRGALQCAPCPPATIAASFAAASCDACPASSSDAAGHTICICLEGYYDASLGANSSGPACASCVDGGMCVGGSLLAQEGWWRESPTDSVFLKCREGYCLPEDAALLAGTAVAAGGGGGGAMLGRRLRQLSGAVSHCADGHSGVLCAVCQDGYTLQGGFCKPCQVGDDWASWSRASKGVTIALFIPAGLLVLSLVVLLPLLPAVEHFMWGCTASLAVAAESVAGASVALFRRCRGAEEVVEPVPRRSSDRISAIERRPSEMRWSSFAFGRVSMSHDNTAAADAATNGEASGEAEAAAAMDTAAGVGSVDELLEAATELFVALVRPGKILINFYQMHGPMLVIVVACSCFLTRHPFAARSVSSFIDTLDVPWPRTFGTIMSRVNIVNINFLQLPRTSCLYPNTSFYSTFQGYTLGTTVGLAVIGASWVLGQRLLAPLTLRSASAAERAHRVRRFQTVCLSRALLLLYLVYPGVSGVVIAVFNCRDLPSGRSVLVADHRETCWSVRHWRYVGAAIFWVIAVPIGIPAAFLGLLFYFRVPHMARAKVANAWLQEAAEHAWRLGVPQPPCDVQTLGFDNVSDEHLELLVSVLVNGEAPAQSEAAKHDDAKLRVDTLRMSLRMPTQRPAGMLRRVRRVMTCGRGGDGAAEPSPARRKALQKALLHWCETSRVLSLPPLTWNELDEDAAPAGEEHDAAAPNAKDLRRVFSGFSTATLTASSRAELAALEQRALRKVGFLFEAYTVQCWSWEAVELGRKLILTSILALVAPGSATQVTVGTLVAFCMLLLFQRHRPYSSPGMNFVASVAQVNLFFVLFVGLLLKVRLNGDATDSKLFNAIVTILSVVPVALPVALKATTVVGSLDGDELEDAMDEADEDAGANSD